MAKKGGLGSGLGALFGDDAAHAASGGEMLPVSKVEPRQDQPRTVFDPEALEALTESIRTHGLIQPITVRPLDNGYYQIIAGERRWRAARAAGLAEIPVHILRADDRQAMELALVENLQREDLNPIEEARGYRTLMEDYGLTQEETAAAVGRSRPAVANALRLLSLSAPVLDLVETGKLSAGHARALVSVRDEHLQLILAQTVIDKGLSVRQTETLAARELKPAPTKKTAPAVDYVRTVELELESALGRKVHLVDGRKKGRLEIEFYGADDREKLIEHLRLLGALRKG